MDAILVEELLKRYGDAQALDGVSFSVHGGEVFGLLGPDGAGKSTTIRTLARLTVPNEGRDLVVGHDVRRQPDAVRRPIGYVQDSAAHTYATGRENLVLQGRIHGMGGRALRERVDAQWVERFLATPASRLALVLSQVVRAGLTAIVRALVILVAGLVLGMRGHGGALGRVVVLLAAALISTVFGAISQGSRCSSAARRP